MIFFHLLTFPQFPSTNTASLTNQYTIYPPALGSLLPCLCVAQLRAGPNDQSHSYNTHKQLLVRLALCQTHTAHNVHYIISQGTQRGTQLVPKDQNKLGS